MVFFLDTYLSSFYAFWRTGYLAKRTFLVLKLNTYLFYEGLCGNTDIISRAPAVHNWTFSILVVDIEIALSSGFCVFLELWSHFWQWKPRNNSLTLFKFPQASLLASNMDCFSCEQEFFTLAGYEARPVAPLVLFLKDYFLLLNLFLCFLQIEMLW